MKVMLISPLPPPAGGMATWTQACLANAVQAGLEATCVNTNYQDRSEVVTGRRDALRELKRAADIWRRVKRHARETSPEVIHLCSACSLSGNLRDFVTLRSARLACKSAKLVLHCHCSLPDYVGAGRVKQAVFRMLCRRTDGVFVLNRQSLAFAESLQVRNVHLLPNFCARPEAADGAPYPEDGRRHVLFIGRTTFDKGFDILLEAARLAQQQGLPVVFDAVGAQDAELSRMGNMPSNVVLHGQLPHAQTMAFMRRADAFLLPSRTEGFPYVVLEAMLCGVPVVASDVGAIGEMLEGTGAEPVETMEAGAFLNALLRVLNGPAAQEIARKEKERYERLYTPQSVLARMRELYGQL